MNKLRQRTVITLTDSAVDRLKMLLAKQEDAEMAIRVGVRRRGCNGLTYTMNYAREAGKLDEVVEDRGVRVIVDHRALMFLIGTEMDYSESDIRSEFVFNNPNSKGECGCGESFNV